MTDLSEYGVTVKEVSQGVYHIKGLLLCTTFVYNKNEDCVVESNMSLAAYKQKIESLYGETGIKPNRERYEKFMAVIDYLEKLQMV